MQNFIKTIINGVQKWTKKEIKDNIKNSTADWSQNDSSAVDYVKNRTHWSDGLVEEVILEQQTVNSDSVIRCPFIVGHTYKVIWDNETYICTAWKSGSNVYLGDGGFIEITGGDPAPFLIYNGWVNFGGLVGAEHTIKITEAVENIHKLDSKYLDLPTNLATTDDVKEAVDVANNAQSIANNKMNANNPVGTGSFSMNISRDATIGDCSHAEGNNCTASGIASHAEGQTVVASGDYSHAEGRCTVASGIASHAEGAGYSYLSTLIASGDYSHAEGYNSSASGKYSHAEGYNCTVSGIASHAEGTNTIVSGDYAHAEGGGTLATRMLQHVQGEYNISDKEGTATTKGKYAHIVGNGTSDTARSNAHTLDWNGVGWYQGGLQVGGNAQDDGAKNVLLEGDAIPIPESATVGQTIAVKSVDENGKPTEWETVALPSVDGLATEEYVDTSIANLVDSAPETLNTLNELATAIQENDNVIDTLNAAITNKITVPQDAAAGDLLTYDGTSWVRISRADLITEIIAALPRAEEATF